MVPNAILFSLKIGVWGRYNRDMERNLRGADKERKGDKMFGFGKKKEAETRGVPVRGEAEKQELLESLEMYYRVFFLGEDVEEK